MNQEKEPSTNLGIKVSSWVLASSASVVMLNGASLFIFYIPKYESIYKDLGIGLPTATEIMIYLGRMQGGYILLAFGVIWILKEFKFNGSGSMLIINGFVTAFSVIVLMIFIQAATYPLFKIIESISSN